MKNKRKALMVATIGGFFRFELNDIKILKNQGYEVHCASNFESYQDSVAVHELKKMGDVVMHQIDFARSPFSIHTLTAFNQIKKLLSEEHFNLIHCHTPVGGILTRLAARKYRKNGTKVFYTAHGFHFFEGAPISNWVLFYPIEWLCSWWTDVLLTINQEDYKRAKEKFHAQKIVYIPGVGIDLEKFRIGNIDRELKRKELGVKKSDKFLLSVGELNENKNHLTVVRAIAELNDDEIHYFIAGQGELADKIKLVSEELGVAEYVHLLGYRNDIAELLQIADVYILPSQREGLNVSLMEAIASKVPVICSKIRGNTDLVKNNDYVFRSNDIDEIKQCISIVLNRDTTKVVQENYENLLAYDVTNVEIYMNKQYKDI